MSFGAWLFVILIGAIFLVITIFLLQKYTKSVNTITDNQLNQIIENFIKEVETVQYWTPTGTSNDPLQPGPDPERNVCALYTFPGREITFQGNTIYEPGRPSLNPEDLINIVPNPNFTETCVDPDQIIAQQFVQTCNNPNQDEGCYAPDGTVYQNGENRIYYNICPGYPPCTSQMASIVTMFDPLDPNNRGSEVCYEVRQSGDIAKAADCDISNYLQIFQISRANPGLSTNDNGPYAKIVHRDTGLCLVPDPNDTIRDGAGIILDTCTPNEGFLWWTLPSMSLGPTACFDPNNIGCNPPQQIVYTPSTNIPLPTSTEDLNNFIENNSNNMYSIRYDETGDNLLLENYNLGLATDSNSWRFNTQILDYPIYETLYNAPVINTGGFVGYPFYRFGF